MVVGPELSKTLTSFESTFIANRGAIRHLEQVPAAESAFDRQGKAQLKRWKPVP